MNSNVRKYSPSSRKYIGSGEDAVVDGMEAVYADNLSEEEMLALQQMEEEEYA